AEHFSQSTDPADLAKAIEYGEMAAERAISVYGFGEAVRLLEQALKVQIVLGPEDRGRYCDLLLGLCHVLSIGGEPRRALDKELPEAFSLAEELGDRARASRACTVAIHCLHASGSINLVTWGSPEAALWTEQADRYAEPETVARAWADLAMAEVKCVAGLYTQQNALIAEGLPLLRRALELARRLGEPQTFWFMACLWLSYAQAPQYTQERWRLAEELEGQSRAGVNVESLGITLMVIANTFLESGQRQRAETLLNEAKELAERSGQAMLELVSMGVDGIMVTLDGLLEDAAEITQKILTRGEELNLYNIAATVALICGPMSLLRLGRADELLRILPAMPASLIKVICQAYPTPDPEVIAFLDNMIAARPEIGSDEDEAQAFFDIMYLEAAVLVGHKQAAELLMRRFADSSLRTTGAFHLTCVDRHLGGAAALLERYDEARKYYDEALKIATEMKFRPEIALTRLQLAELLLEHYPKEKAAALKHLDFAIKEFRDMKMQ
ncbi:MAG: tetratricopeptide repeat protein, partial [Dehalococcoidia bacterium]|nr:tetratricopeptide repeat protein [Dehalococcoidia bacterium]